jgi:hypothetical protein
MIVGESQVCWRYKWLHVEVAACQHGKRQQLGTCTREEAALSDEAWCSGGPTCMVHRVSEAGFCGRRLQSIRNLISPGFRAFRASVTQVS